MTVRLVMIERPIVWRIEWLTIAPNGSPGVPDPVLADAVEDDDRVVDAEPDDRQQGGHEQGVELEAEEEAEDREQADDEDHVVEQRDDRRRAETEAEPDPQVGEDEELADDDEHGGAADEVGADDRADRGGAPWLAALHRAEALDERRRQVGELGLDDRGRRRGRAGVGTAVGVADALALGVGDGGTLRRSARCCPTGPGSAGSAARGRSDRS